MIFRLLGTNGSGKSTIVFALFRMASQQQRIYSVALGQLRPEAYALALPSIDKPLYVIGPYRTACGGCDAIHPFDLIPPLVKKYADRGHVLFEGILAGSTYGRLGELMAPFKRDAIWVFLDTSQEECIRRVEARRAAANDDRPFNPTNLIGKHNQVRRLRQRVEQQAEMTVIPASTETGAPTIIRMLQYGPQS
jgi:hypothetical protein